MSSKFTCGLSRSDAYLQCKKSIESIDKKIKEKKQLQVQETIKKGMAILTQILDNILIEESPFKIKTYLDLCLKGGEALLWVLINIPSDETSKVLDS